MITSREALTGAAFLAKLPAFLRHPLQATETKVRRRRRIEGRRATFLRIFREAIYQQPIALISSYCSSQDAHTATWSD
jgi:hypothetical protein